MAISQRASSLFAAAAVLLRSVSAHAVTPEQKCQQKKLKAWGKLEFCLKKNAAKVLGGKPDASASCQTKFSAALTKAGTCRYLDNGDGTVSDLHTGLMWERKDDLGGIHDTDNGYTSSAAGTARDGTAFTFFLGILNNGASVDAITISGCFAGHCDWRMPTIADLQTILLAPSPCGTAPCIDPMFGPTTSGLHWSATTGSGGPGTAWAVSFQTGALTSDLKTYADLVRAVRGGL